MEIVKDSKPYVYRLEGKRGQPVEREDGRKENGRVLEYQYELNTLVLDYLRTECSDQFFTHNSLSQWLIKMGIVSEEIVQTQYNRTMQKDHLLQLKIKYSDQFTSPIIVKNFTRIIMKRLKQNLATVFDNLEKLGLIELRREKIACLLDDTYRPLTSEENTEIRKLKGKLFVKYGLNGQDFYKDDMSHQIEKYYDEFYVELEERFSIKFTYHSYSVRWKHGAIATRVFLYDLMEKGKIQCQYNRYLLSEVRKSQLLFDLMEKFSVKSILLAKKRAEKSSDSDHRHIFILKYLGWYTDLWKQMLEYFKLSHFSYQLEDEWYIG